MPFSSKARLTGTTGPIGKKGFGKANIGTRVFDLVSDALVSRCDPHGRFTILYRPDDTGGAAHSCAAGHTTCDNDALVLFSCHPSASVQCPLKSLLRQSANARLFMVIYGIYTL